MVCYYKIKVSLSNWIGHLTFSGQQKWIVEFSFNFNLVYCSKLRNELLLMNNLFRKFIDFMRNINNKILFPKNCQNILR